MPLASTDRVRLTYKPEASYGVPVTASTCYSLRNSGDTLNLAINYTQSNELNQNRTLRDNIRVDADGSGAINFDFSYGEYDWFLQAVLQGTWAVYGTNGVGTAFAGTFAASTITAGAAPTGNNAFTNLALGQWIKIAGSTNPLHNIWVQVSKTTPPSTTVITLEGTPFTGAVGSGGSAVTVSASRLRNGTTFRTATIERLNSDVSTPVFNLFTGFAPNTFNLNVALGEVVGGSFDFIGKERVAGTATGLNATVTPSLNNRVFDATSGVANIVEGGAVVAGTFIQNLAIAYNNNNRAQKGIGFLGAQDQGVGQIDLRLTGSLYFKDQVLYNKFRNSTDTDFSFRLNDPSLNGYVFTVPAGNITSYSDPVNGKNADVMVEFEITAKDDGSGNMLIIDRGGVAVTLPT